MGNKFRLQFEDGITKTVSATIKPPKDIIQFVAGTTDPINTTGLKHQANKDYWRGANNFWEDVKDLKPQYLDLHVEDTFFSWSGDNNTEDRNEAAERLLDLLLRVYSNWTHKEIHLHLIGHSHGGNVINQFTNHITENPDFPRNWKVKSITYLSTPFFKEQHQLNHEKLHADCKIINVYNEYDITQRFVADFTLKNLEYIIGNFKDKDKIDKAIEAIRDMDKSSFDHLTDIVINNHTEGPAMWQLTHDLLEEFEKIIVVIVSNITFIGEGAVVAPEKREFLGIMNALLGEVGTRKNRFLANAQNRSGGYGRSEFLEDLALAPFIALINRIIHIETDECDSYLLNLLDTIFTEEENGLILKIDDTSWSPKDQVKDMFAIQDFNITDLDIYDKRNKKSAFESFAKGIEDEMIKNNDDSLKKILMRLISQFINPEDVSSITSTINKVEYIATGAIDAELKRVRRNLTTYNRLIERYNADLITESDQNNDSLNPKPGSIPYLAMNAHGLSHTKLFDDATHNVREALTSCFSSGSNPGFKG